MKPYYQDDSVTLYNQPYLDLSDGVGYYEDIDAIVTDPPYGETSLAWDRWPDGWPGHMVPVAKSMWCFGSFRMFMDRLSDFSEWKFSHEIVWEKQNGSGFATDKFRRVHELATLWYQGEWSSVRHEVPRVPAPPHANKNVRRSPKDRGGHTGSIGGQSYADDGFRMTNSVVRVANEQGKAVHPTQKPVGIVSPLIEFSVPVGGLVFDPFAGSGTTLLAAKLSGRRGIGTEVNEAYCEAAALRLSQQTFDFEALS